MMRKIVMLSNIEYTIHRPIVSSVVEDLKENFFHESDLFVSYIDNKENNDFNSSDNIYTKNETLTKFIEVNPSIVTDEDKLLTNVVMRDIKRPILLDKKVLFDVSANTLRSIFTIHIKYYNKSKDSLIKMLNQLKLSTIADNYYDQHVVEYYYTLPKDLLRLIREIVDLKYGKDKSYYKYLESIAKLPLEYLNSSSGEYNIPIVRERQPVIGNLEGDIATLELGNDNRGWFIEFDYKLEIEIPTFLIVNYPILVNNKVINEIFLPKETLIELIEGSDNIVDALYKQIGFSMHDEIRNGEPIIRYPSYDDFTFNVPQKPGMLRLISFLLIIEENSDILLNLDDMISMFINQDTINYFKDHKSNRLFQPLEDIFYFELFENNRIVDYNLTITEDNYIKADRILDITKSYRLVLNGVYDFDYLIHKLKRRDPQMESYMEIIEKLKIRTVRHKETVLYTTMLNYIIAKRKGV